MKGLKGVISDIHLPVEAVALLCAVCASIGWRIGHLRTARRLDPRRTSGGDPLSHLLKPENLGKAVDLAARRDAMRAVSRAVLHGRIDQLASLGQNWNSDTQSAVREHVAAVMRAGLRRGDHLALGSEETQSGAFIITLGGTDERAAVRIADRLRRKLAQLSLPQLGSEARLTASFGVAAERSGDGADGLDRRARRALDAAVAKGADHVVPASDIEEIMLLPAPASAQPASAA